MIEKWPIVLLFLFLFNNFGCKRQNKNNASKALSIPDSFKNIPNLKVYPLQSHKADTVTFKEVQVFESNEEVFMAGYTGSVAIDNENRVYIVSEIPGTVHVYVFNTDGNFLTRFIREGRGPGEFEAIGSMIVKNSKLYVSGPRLQKLSVFSLDDYSVIDEYLIKRNILKADSIGAYRAADLISVDNHGTMLIKFRVNKPFKPNKDRTINYYHLTDEGKLKAGRILKQKGLHWLTPDSRFSSEGFIRMPRTTPFTRSSIIAVSDHYIFSIRTDAFLIKVYDKTGNYLRTIYYPYSKSELNVSDLDLSDGLEGTINENKDQIPDTWPAVHTMFVDDQNRLWVLTITDSKTHYLGWVLAPNGELLATFNWPGKRNERTPIVKPLFIVKNGYLYTRERNIREGIDRIIKWKITFKPNPKN